MKAIRRKVEEVCWAFGVYGLVRSAYRWKEQRAARQSGRLREFYRRLLPRPSLVFDIGANTGRYAEVIESLGHRVVAVEPNRDCVRHMEIAFDGKVQMKIVCAVAGERCGLASIQLSDVRDDVSTLDPDWPQTLEACYGSSKELWNRTESVPMITVAALAEQFGPPDFVKIDVEGYESCVLDGMAGQPPLVSFEVHRFLLEKAFACIDKPVFAANSRFNITDASGSRLELDEWICAAQMKQFLRSIQDAKSYRDVYVRPAGIPASA